MYSLKHISKSSLFRYCSLIKFMDSDSGYLLFKFSKKTYAGNYDNL
jgi:hypothetical protein